MINYGDMKTCTSRETNKEASRNDVEATKVHLRMSRETDSSCSTRKVVEGCISVRTDGF